MDEVSELFDSYVPDIDFRSLMFCSRVEKPNFLPDLSVVLALTIALTFFLIFCKLKHRWLVNVKCSFCNCMVRVWRGSIHWWFCYNCKRINSATESPPVLADKSTSSIEESKENSPIKLNDLSTLTEDKDELTEDFNNLRRILATKFPTNLKVNNSPNDSFRRDNSFPHFKNDLSAFLNDVENLPNKIIHKKLIENNLIMKHELLKAEKKLFHQMKELNELHKELRNFKENTINSSKSQNETIGGHSYSRIKRRSTFGDSFKDSNLRVEEEKKEDIGFQLFPILERIISLSKVVQSNEITHLKDQLNEKEEMVNKLDELYRQTMEFHKTLLRNEQLIRKREAGSIKLKELSSIKECQDQDTERRDLSQFFTEQLKTPQSRIAPAAQRDLDLQEV